MRQVAFSGPGRLLRRIWSSDILLGVVVVVVAVSVLAALAILYLRPMNQKTFTFETTDASAITSGQDIRVAGISVGKVSGLSIGADRVTVTGRIDDSTRLGDKSKVEVRMLTPVGGYAITLIPLGDNPLQGSIPAERVTVPYSIGDLLQKTPRVTEDVEATDVNANLTQVATALRSNSTSLRSIVDGMNSMTGIFDRQRDQMHQIAALASEYMQSFNANRQFVFELIRKIDTVVSTYNVNSAGFNYTYYLLGMILSRLMPFEKFYLKHSDLVREKIYVIRDAIVGIQRSMGPALDNLTRLRGGLAAWLTPSGMREVGGGALWTDNVCVPVPGREC